MDAFTITRSGNSQTFTPGIDFADGETRQHWTLCGLEKLILLGLWQRELDRRGTVLKKPPTVEQVRRVGAAPASHGRPALRLGAGRVDALQKTAAKITDEKD